jgi:hypothetical protein
MDLTLRILPENDATPREVAVATTAARNALERVRGVSRVDAVRVAAPEQAKGIAALLGQLAVSVAPGAVQSALQTVGTVLSRQAPTKLEIEHKDTKFRFEFDPRRTSLQELVDAAERLRMQA